MAGYLAASASRSPISTSAGTTPGHSVLAPRNQSLTPDQPRGVEGVAGDQHLHALAVAQIRSDDDTRGGAVAVQQEHFEGIAEIIVVELVIADAVQAHRSLRRDHEVERGAQGPRLRKRRRQSARRDLLLARVCQPHESQVALGSSSSRLRSSSAVNSAVMAR